MAAYPHPLDLDAAPALGQSDGPAAPGLRFPGPDLYPGEAIEQAGEEATQVREHRRSTRPVGPGARELVRFGEWLVDELTVATLEEFAGRRRVAAAGGIDRQKRAEHRSTDIPWPLFGERVLVRGAFGRTGESVADGEQARGAFRDSALLLVQSCSVVIDDRPATAVERQDHPVGDLVPG